MRYCKVKATGRLIEAQAGDDNLEVMYTNNASYARDELEVGIESEAVIKGWYATQHLADMTYADKRKQEYPSIEELIVACYDTDDKAAIDKRRADVKAKYPKP